MSKKGTKVTPKEVQKMIELYKELGTYKAVAKRLRRDAKTVSFHIRGFVVASEVVAINNTIRGV